MGATWNAGHKKYRRTVCERNRQRQVHLEVYRVFESPKAVKASCRPEARVRRVWPTQAPARNLYG